MALTHEERRQFAKIEQEFHRSDRHRIFGLRRWRPRNRGGRRRAFGLLVIAIGAVVMLATLTMSTLISFAGFLVALAGAWLADLERLMTTRLNRMLDRIRTAVKEAPNV